MSAKGVDDGGDVIFLEEADGGDAGGSGLQAGFGILQSDSTQGDNRDAGAAGLAQRFGSLGKCAGGVFLFEDWGEDGQICAVGGGLGDFFWGVTRDRDQQSSWRDFAGEGARATRSFPDLSHFCGHEIACGKVNAGGICGDGYVGAGVDEEGSGQVRVFSSPFLDYAHRFAGQGFKVADGKIFFAELDVVEVGAGGFGDLVEEMASAGAFVSGEGGAVGDVVKEGAIRHQDLV
jgi:hypothetical protein